MPREILVDWTMPSGSGFRSVMYFQLVTAVASQRSALGTFLNSCKAFLDSNTTYTIETSGRELDDATGALTGVWSDATAFTGAGTIAGQSVPDAAQVLIRWNTNHIVGSRFLKGHQYIPGLTTAQVTDGNVSAAAVTGFTNAATTLIAAGIGFTVWHRPTAGAGGVVWAAQTGTCWTEFAILRGRRG